jgi:hypothetical protein
MNANISWNSYLLVMQADLRSYQRLLFAITSWTPCNGLDEHTLIFSQEEMNA